MQLNSSAQEISMNDSLYFHEFWRCNWIILEKSLLIVANIFVNSKCNWINAVSWIIERWDFISWQHQIDSKSNIRVLKVQLNFKLKWVTHMHHVEAKLVIKQKIMQTIIESTWDSSMMTRKQIYFVMIYSLLSHEVIIWYMSQTMKNH